MPHGTNPAAGPARKPAAGNRATPKTSPPAAPRRPTPGIVTVPAWHAHPWLIAGFSTRQGGLSTAYAAGGPSEQNLGYTPDDDPATILAARHRLVSALTKSHTAKTRSSKSPTPGPPELVTIRQCHTGIIRRIDATPAGNERRPGTPDATPAGNEHRPGTPDATDLPVTTPGHKALLCGDGLYTRDPNLLLGILTADCVPVLVADTRTHAVAAFHAGWRGTVARIVERGIGTLRRDFGSRPQDLIAAIGPSIGACCFAIGPEVREEFESQFAYAPELFTEVFGPTPIGDPVREKYPMLFLTARAPGHSNLGPQLHMDLWEANRRQLLAAGLRPKAIQVIGHCTACTRLRDGRRKYFSHRAEQGHTGRMLSLIGTTAHL